MKQNRKREKNSFRNVKSIKQNLKGIILLMTFINEFVGYSFNNHIKQKIILDR